MTPAQIECFQIDFLPFWRKSWVYFLARLIQATNRGNPRVSKVPPQWNAPGFEFGNRPFQGVSFFAGTESTLYVPTWVDFNTFQLNSLLLWFAETSPVLIIKEILFRHFSHSPKALESSTAAPGKVRVSAKFGADKLFNGEVSSVSGCNA